VTQRRYFSKDGRFDELKKALAERVNAEPDEHLESEAAAVEDCSD
jgi:putative transposase